MSTIQEKVFEAFPAFPHYTTIHSLFDSLPQIHITSIENAVWRLVRLGKVERDNERKTNIYRLVRGATRPIDMRGHHGKSGRRAKCRLAPT